MRTVIGGTGQDNTAAVKNYLATNNKLLLRDLYLIGAPEDPRSIWLTNHEAPVLYSPWGTFQPAVVSRGGVTAKIGLEVQQLEVTWSPGSATATASMATASPRQRARLHIYDNWPVHLFRAFMPAPGDANTLGCADWFGGRVDTCIVDRGQLVFRLKSFLNVVTQKIPSTVVEVTNPLAAYAGASRVPGDPSLPVFKCFTGSTVNQIYADCLTPTANKIYSGNQFQHGYMVFLDGPGATLAGAWSAIGGNGRYTDGSSNSHSAFTIYSPLPWPPTPGVDTFYVSKAAPINLGDESYYGFPYVPSPQTAV
ncbi:MAG TPA: hypothetical protein VM554_12845 [Acidisarcina sp.]|nr:hypothetical protein [Acidisarcina sp.]